MKYKGFNIAPIYAPGSNFKVTKDARAIPRKPKKEDILYFEINDPMDGDKRWAAEKTIPECRAAINGLLNKIDMKSNSQKEWDKLK